MFRSKLYLPLLAMSAMLLSACAWVETTHEGKKVEIADAQQVTGCKVLGKTTVQIAHKVAGMKRQEHIVKGEIEKLAKNSAAELGGDTIVPVSEMTEGKQTFRVLKCRTN